MFASSHARPRSGGAGDARPRAPEPSATERGALITSGRLSVLEQLEKSLKQDRPWEKESWADKDKPYTPKAQRVTSFISTPPFNASKIDRSLEKAEHAAVGWDATRYQGHRTDPKSSVGILKNGSGPSQERQPPLAHTLGKNHLPGSLEQCHDLILDLQAQLRSTEMLDAFEIEKKEQTIEGISDMFALSALLPDKTRMYREYNEMKVKYQENLEQLTRLQAELDRERKEALDTQERLKSTLAQAVASTDGAKILAAEEKVREIHKLRLKDADVAVKAVESATRRADVSEQRLRDVEERLRSHPVVKRHGLAEKELESLLPELLARTESKAEQALESERKLLEAERALNKALKDLEDARKQAAVQPGNVGRFNAEMDSLSAKLAKTEADLKTLQLEHSDVLKHHEDLANEAEQIALTMEREAAQKDALISELQNRNQLAQDQATRLQDQLTASSDAKSAAADRQRVQADVLAIENSELRSKLSETQASLAESARMRDHAETRASELEKRAAESAAAASNLMAQVQEAEGALQRTRAEKKAELEEKDRELQRLRGSHSDSSRNARDAAEQATQRVQTLEKLLSTARDEAVAVKMHAERETASAQQQLKDGGYALKEAKDEAAHAQRMHQLAVSEAADVRKQLDSTRKELQRAREQLHGNEEKIHGLESSLSAMDVAVEKQTEQMRREHAEELARAEKQLLTFQDGKRRVESELAREVQLRLADRQSAADQLKCDMDEERKRSEHALELQKRRNAEELEVQASTHKRAVSELEETMQRERLASHAKVLEVEETLHEEASRRRELEEEVPRLRRELEALRPVEQSYSALQQQMRATEDDNSRLRQELDAALHEGEQAKSRADGLESELRRSGAKVGSLEEQVAHGLQVAEASNKDAENAFIEVQRLQAQLANAEQALAASHGDTSALRERLKEDARARAEHEVSATRAMEEILLERESERERETEERAKALAQLQATHDKAIQELKEAHAEEMEAMLEERNQAWQRAEERVARLQRTQSELETALAKSHTDRESEEMQAHEAMNIVAAEMGALRNDCAALEEQLATLRKEKVEEAKQVLQLNMALEEQAHEHEQAQGSLKAALKVADDEIEKLKTQYRKLQSDLSTEKGLREREQEEAQKELKELARLQLEVKARDDRLESMRTEALMLKAEVLSSSPQRSSATPLQSQRRSLAAQQCPSTPGMGRDDSEASESENRNSQWESLMVNGQDKLTVEEMLSLAHQRKVRIEQLFRSNVKREMADSKASSSPAAAVCISWEVLLVLLGHSQVKEALEELSRASTGGESRLQHIEWRNLRRFININPGQFDQASVLYLMEHHVPGQINAVQGGWKLKDRIDRAVFLLNGLTYQDCKAESVTAAALYEWNTLVVDMHRLCKDV